jgi:RNA polymerase sigma-70 factor (ECF subfamily)
MVFAVNTKPSSSERMAEPSTPATEWVDLYSEYLYHFALGQVRNPTIAEDLVQDTFLAAFKARDRFAGASSERTWLVSILRHKIYDHLRQQTRRPTVSIDTTGAREEEDSLVWVHEVAADCMEPDRRMDLDEFRQSLEIALGKLPERIAQVFQMYEIGDCSGEEVCAALNISKENLWVMLHRARKHLSRELAGWRRSGDEVGRN